MNCLFRGQHIVGFWTLLNGGVADAHGRIAKSYGMRVTASAMPVVASAYPTTHTTQFHKGRSILVR